MAEADEAKAAESLKAGSVAAFLHFRYENEEGALIAKMYDLQVAPGARRRGLGKFATMLGEMVARKAGMGGKRYNAVNGRARFLC